MTINTQSNEGKRRASISTWLVILLLAVGISCQLNPSGQDTVDEGTTDRKPHGLVHSGPGFDFATTDHDLVAPNAMHQAHALDDRTSCADCHTADRNIPHTEAHKYCIECHEDGHVADPVWENHCLSCHHFTEADTKYAEDNGILHSLCVECHGDEGVVHHAFSAESSHDISCENCHSPHETTLVFGGKLCEECHEDIVAATSEETRVHGSCLACHTPHTGIDEIELYCTKCHYASEEILIHNVPDHPKDCLACHKAHFSEAEIGDDACLACHDDTFYGGHSNLPKPHRDCENCHYSGNFAYRGDEVCAGCHEHEGHVISEANLPTEHAHCSTCHPAHSWYSEFEQNCDNCHQLEAVIEHNLSFHQHECATCHDPHTTSTMTNTGHCSGCHTDPEYPDFRPGTMNEHLLCNNCHDQVAIDSRRFSFTGPSDSCLLCHPYANLDMTVEWDEIPFGHKVCNVCHSAHRFESVGHADSCDLCHVDIYYAPPSTEHAECMNCHGNSHQMHFLGQGDTCEMCHMDAVEGLAAIAGHPTDCDTCHSVHGEPTVGDACEMCHFELPGLHASPMAPGEGCATCHGLHSMEADPESCSICHIEECPEDNPACLECHAFRDE